MANKKNAKKVTAKKAAAKKVTAEKVVEKEEVVEKVTKKESSKKSNTTTLILILVGVIAFIVVSFMLPSKEAKKPEKNPAVSEWAEKVKTGESITVLASSTCPHCQEYKPVINRLSSDHGFDLYFFELDEFSEDEQNILVGTFELKNFSGAVPYSFIVRDGKFVDDAVGYSNEESVVNFLKKNGLIK